MNILFVHMAALGDAIMASLALRLLRKSAPDARISVLAKSAGARYFSRLDWIDEVIGFPASKWIDRGRLHLLPLAIPSLVSLLRKIRRARFDAVIQWRMDSIDSLISHAAGAPVRVAAAHRYLGARAVTDRLPGCVSRSVVRVSDGLHLAELMAVPVREALERLGISPLASDADSGGLEFPIDDVEQRNADDFLAEHELMDFVEVCISSETIYNRWPAEKWAEVIDGIARETGLPVLIDGLARDVSLEAEICALTRCVPVRACGKLGLGEMGAVLQRARCLVSFNSAPIHVAAALGTPVVVANGRDGYAMSPWGTRNIIVTVNEHYPLRHPDRSTWEDLVARVPAEEVIAAAVQLSQVTKP